MKEFVEKLIERLEDEKSNVPVNRLLDDIINDKPKELGQLMAYSKAIKIVNQLAEEYGKDTNVSTIDAGELLGNSVNDGWIPCSERLPENGTAIRVWLSFTNPVASFTKRAWWSDDHFEWDNGQNLKELPLAWMPSVAPTPYQPKGE